MPDQMQIAVQQLLLSRAILSLEGSKSGGAGDIGLSPV